MIKRPDNYNKEENVMDFLKLVQENWDKIVELVERIYNMFKDYVLGKEEA